MTMTPQYKYLIVAIATFLVFGSSVLSIIAFVKAAHALRDAEAAQRKVEDAWKLADEDHSKLNGWSPYIDGFLIPIANQQLQAQRQAEPAKK